MKAHKHIYYFLALIVCANSAWAQGGGTGDPKISVLVQNETAVNSKGLDFSPTFYEDGIVFISTNDDGLKKERDPDLKLPAMSILRARRTSDGPLNAPEPFAKELTSAFHEGPVCFDRTAETVYFSRNVTLHGKQKLDKDRNHRMRIYSAKKSGDKWGEPEPLPFNTNEFDDCHPVISIDGDKLFFASNRPGGLGGMDLYVAYKLGESWSEPVNLGAGVNTKGNEAFPFIHADNTLYFASDGLEDRKGGFDLFYVIPEGDKWTKPINIGEPFNTGGDDFGLIVDLNKINGYFSSNGAGGTGGDEILNFHVENGNLDAYLLQNKRVPERNLDLNLLVTDKVKGSVIPDATVQLLNYDNNNVIGRDEDGNLITVQMVEGQEVMKSMPPDNGINGMTDAKGRFAAEIKTGNYVVIVSKKGYQTKQVRIPINKPGNELAVQLEKEELAEGKLKWTPSLFNYVTNAPLAGAMVVLTDQTTGKRDTMIADANGQIDYVLDKNKRYTVDMFQGNRLIGTTEINTDGSVPPSQLLTQNISVAPLLPGSKIELPNIYYNYNDATLRPDARKDLDMVSALLRQQPNVSIELTSHTDSRGTDEYNNNLSQLRANGVVAYLVNRGISRERMQPLGLGESTPRNNCRDGVECSEQQHARNRRTEIRINTGLQSASMVYVDGQVNGTEPEPQRPEARHSGGTGVKKDPIHVNPLKTGQYYVVAGSFMEEPRAQNRLQELLDKGFSNAEIHRFPGSNFYSVCVGQYETRNAADEMKRRVAKTKVEVFVRGGM
jgi:outer membrane protein OmpA-like peptidoglycan-associated protein